MIKHYYRRGITLGHPYLFLRFIYKKASNEGWKRNSHTSLAVNIGEKLF